MWADTSYQSIVEGACYGRPEINYEDKQVLRLLFEDKLSKLGVPSYEKKIIRLIGHSNGKYRYFYDQKNNRIIPVLVKKNWKMKLLSNKKLQKDLKDNGFTSILTNLCWLGNKYEEILKENKLFDVLQPLLVIDEFGNCIFSFLD